MLNSLLLAVRPGKKPDWVIRIWWLSFRDWLVLSKAREATDRSKFVIERFKLLSSICMLKLLDRNYRVRSSILKNYWVFPANLEFISAILANFLRLSVVRLILPLTFRSSTLRARTFLVSLIKYSLNLTATRLFLQINWPRLGISNEIFCPWINF